MKTFAAFFFFLLLLSLAQNGSVSAQDNLIASEFVDVVIPCSHKDIITLEKCIEGIRNYCTPIRRVIVVSEKKFSNNAEWVDEKLYPFTKESIANEIFHGNQNAVKSYLRFSNNRIYWFYQQFIKLYAPLVIPNVAEDVLIVDADVIFLNHVEFIDALGYRLYGASGEYNRPYFDFNKRLINLERTLPFSGICHHTLMRRPIIQKLFDTIAQHHKASAWRAMCRLIDAKQLFKAAVTNGPCSPMAENELYPNFARLHDPLFKIRHLRFTNSNEMNRLDQHKHTYHFAAFHAWMQNGNPWSGEPLVKGTDHNIVFIHIGSNIPSYLMSAIKQARLFNELCSIYLITSSSALRELAKFQFDLRDVIFINYEKLPTTEAHRIFSKKCTLTGFWRATIERFFVLHNFMQWFNIQNVFHLENDTMLYVNLSKLLPVFSKNYSIAIPFDNDERAIASLVYVKNANVLKNLTDFIAEKSMTGLNDMQLMALFKKNHGEVVKQLPVIMPQYLQHNKLKSTLNHVAKVPERYADYFEEFNCIFDAAALGQYLGGVDPAHKNSSPGFINESCLFNPSLFDYEWQKEPNELMVPYVVFKNQKYKIATLHIHSKRLELFSSKNLLLLSKNVGSEEVKITKNSRNTKKILQKNNKKKLKPLPKKRA